MFGILFYPIVFGVTYWFVKKNVKITYSTVGAEDENIEQIKNGLLVYALHKVNPGDFNDDVLPCILEHKDKSVGYLEYVLSDVGSGSEYAQDYNDQIDSYLRNKFQTKDDTYGFFERYVNCVERNADDFETVDKTICELENAVKELAK